MNSFDIIMANCPFLKEVIENKINEEVAKVQKYYDKKFNLLEIALFQMLPREKQIELQKLLDK